MAKNKNTVVELVETTTEIEAPYELPEGWKWVRISDVSECKDGYRKPVNADERNNRQGNIPYYGATGQVGWIDDYLTDEQLVLVGEDGAPFLDLIKDKAYLIEGKAWVNNHAHILKSKYAENGNKFLLYYLNNFNYTGYVNGTTRLKLTQSTLLGIPFPLPPTLEEQLRIVNRIETLFAKLDQAKEKAQNVVDTFETRKASILHKAFTGELTKKWREENGVGEDSWVEKLFSELGKSNLGKMLDAKKNTGSDVLYLRNVNVRWFDFDLTDLLTMKAKNEEIEKLSLKKGDLFICEGGEPGRCAVWKEEDSNIIFQKAIHRFKPNNNVSSDFIAFSLFYLNSIGQLSNYFTGTTIKHLTGQSLSKIKISLPSLPEQTEIVCILDILLEKETKAKESAEAVLEQIDLLKKSILARAFRGEL